MPVHNVEIASILDKYADLLELEGANQFRVRAYRTAARTVNTLSRDISDMVSSGEELTALPGVGKDLAAKITEIVTTGSLSQMEQMMASLPPSLIEITQVAGLGPKRAMALYQKLGITDLNALREAAEGQKIRGLSGFGEKTEKAILADLERRAGRTEQERLKYYIVDRLARSLLAYLSETPGVERVEAAGSYRRGMETVGDLDILAVHREGSDIMERFTGYEDVNRVLARGETRSSVVLRFGLQVDLRVIPPESYGSALQYFTGSKAHGVALRRIGVKQGLKLNEYGLFRGEERVAGSSEAGVYNRLGLPWIEPELREDRGEIEAAQKGQLPHLVTLEDIKGDLHAHSTYTEGRASLEELIDAARKKGYRYLAITDHSKRLSMTHGLDEKRLAQQMEEIDRLNENMQDFTLLKGIEVDILEDGSLDLDKSILQELDLVVCSVHHKFNLEREKQTERIIRAISDNPFPTILGHPTGRLIGVRDAYEVDMERILRTAAENGCVMEINAQPDRLDLNDIYCKMAKDMEVRVAVSADAHSINDLDFMRFGVLQARRGWLEPDDVLNTRSLEELTKMLRK